MPINQALAICGINHPNALAAFAHEGLANVADFATMMDEEIKDMCKAMSARRVNQHGYQLGAVYVKRVRALAHWARKLNQLQLPIADDGFTHELLNQAILELDVGGQEEAEVKKPSKLNPEDWDLWEPGFINYVSSLNGVLGTPLAYVIRKPDLTPNDFPADDEY